MKVHALLLSAAMTALVACAEQPADTTTAPAPTPEAAPETPQPAGPELGSFGITLSDIKQEVAPGDDFYRFVNGKWLDTFVIPEEFSNYGSFTVLFERSEARVKSIIEDAAAGDAAPGSIEQKIGDFYASYLDTAIIDSLGMTPLAPQFAAYDAALSHKDLAAAMYDIGMATGRPTGMYVDVDAKRPDQYAVYMTQSGLGMPNRDYYLNEEFAPQRDAYLVFLAQMLTFAGVENPVERAKDVFGYEKRLAEAHWSPAKRRNRDLTYNLYTLAELKSYAPGLPWDAILAALKLDDQDEFVVRENSAIQASAEVFANTPVGVIRDYMKAHAVRAYAAILPRDVDQASFEFYGKAISGVPAQRVRWKRGVSAVNGALGEAVGQVYVERYFPPQSKAMMEELVDNLKAAFAKRLNELEWMGEATKEEARSKLAGFTTKIGYPDKWTDYSALVVEPGDAFGNRVRSDVFDYEQMIAKLGGPIDTTEWFMTPQTVNAYYSPNRNEIVFPAAILQAPFFDPAADPAVNYGGIGAVIGHEIGHGFDDQGRKSDGTGLQRDWWTDEDAARFDALASKLGDQFAQYSPIEGLFVNPELTMGENIGDLGGVTMAYEAYRLSLGGQEAPELEGFTGDQRFFMAWAQVWKRKYRENELKRRLVTDAHSPSEYRTNGVVRNMDAWYDAFDVKPGQDLYLAPEDRVKIW